jgi:hypothetical protein
MAKEKKVPFGGYPQEEIQWRPCGPIAQRNRACGYEPRCRGFESLLAHNLPKGEGPLFYFLLRVGKSIELGYALSFCRSGIVEQNVIR